MSVLTKKLDIFCGTGGVGKTTLAASRGLSLARLGHKVLLITIDPARRLKQVMGIDNALPGEVTPVSLKHFFTDSNAHLDVVLMNPAATLKRVAARKGDPAALDNSIVRILTRPYGGMNEIMAIIELQHQLETGNYDHIVLDTPPGKHFIDFLSASAKINAFFDSSFIELFRLVARKGEKTPGFFQRLVSSGVKKLLSYLEKVTGQGFVEEFISAIAGIYQNKDVFVSALAFEKDLRRREFCNWFLVTSQEQIKEKDALELKERAGALMHDDNYLAINRSLRQALENWHPSPIEPLNELKDAMLKRQNRLKGLGDERFKATLEFPEIAEAEPAKQVAQLAKHGTKTIMISSKLELDELITRNWNSVNTWIDDQMSQVPTPIYSSVDIRESKDKYAPVDHNMYPAGFNNVCALDQDACSSAFGKAIKKYAPNAKRVAILPESNTKNLFYLDHLAILGKILRDSGVEVSFISFDENIFEGSDSLKLLSHSKFDIEIQKAQLNDGIIFDREGALDMVVLNNDQSRPIEIDWNHIKTPVAPTPKIGWFKRQKVHHFRHYKAVVDAFAKEFNIDPNLLMADFTCVGDVDFSSKDGLDRLALAVDTVKDRIANKNAKIFVKGSQGTYGMGIMVVNSGQDILTMNRKERNKMDIGKNSIKFTTLLVQEGVETILKYDDMPAEVTIYLVDGKGLGGFMRANGERDSQANLNSRGMVFKKYCISEIRENQDHKCKEAVYSVVARLATLAAGYEIKDVL